MKIKYVFLSMLACCTMAACSNDEVAEGSNNGNVSLEGESYMAIRLVASNETGARASEGNPAFELGTGDENEVTSAEFYFYDDEGTFVVKGKTISSFEWTDQTAGSNIESISKVMVVLENVPEAPTQVLAVLNGGTVVGDLTNMNMTQALAKTIDAYSYEAGETKKTTYFVMSNSAYVTSGKVQWTTPITTANLQTTADLAEKHPVDIYVERVAAKVELAKSGTFSASVSGDIQVDGESADLEITVNGWGLSGTNKSAYCVKNIQNTTYWTGWNAENNSRSYWAEDPNYSTGNYPSDYDGWNAQNADHWALNYITYNNLTLSAEAGNEVSAYCLENTMDKTTLAYDATTQSLQEPAVTHVLIAATMNVKGSAAQTLYRYKGYFYTESEYKKAVLSDWEATGEGMIYTKTEGVGEDADTYTPLAVSDVEVEDKGAGKVNLKLTATALAETWYTLEGYNPESGTATSATEFDSDKLATLFADVNDADGFKDGKMYYCVPIEHLNATKGEVGSYGVVRNHLYKLTLDKIENLGTAVYDPGEAIIPDYNPETYYVAARLNILSWHIVEQNVSL